MIRRPRLTEAKIARLERALRAVAETEAVNQPHYVDPRAHEVRADISQAHSRVVGVLRAILRSPP